MECLGCNDPICDACREHTFSGCGYRKYQGETLCEHCFLDRSTFFPVRCDSCGSTKVRGVCAHNGKPAECGGCPADEYAEETE
jgi:hypothetical protein